jgi:hypothetical protein
MRGPRVVWSVPWAITSMTRVRASTHVGVLHGFLPLVLMRLGLLLEASLEHQLPLSVQAGAQVEHLVPRAVRMRRAWRRAAKSPPPRPTTPAGPGPRKRILVGLIAEFSIPKITGAADDRGQAQVW